MSIVQAMLASVMFVDSKSSKIGGKSSLLMTWLVPKVKNTASNAIRKDILK
jgi:hypothetical protein